MFVDDLILAVTEAPGHDLARGTGCDISEILDILSDDGPASATTTNSFSIEWSGEALQFNLKHILGSERHPTLWQQPSPELATTSCQKVSLSLELLIPAIHAAGSSDEKQYDYISNTYSTGHVDTDNTMHFMYWSYIRNKYVTLEPPLRGHDLLGGGSADFDRMKSGNSEATNVLDAPNPIKESLVDPPMIDFDFKFKDPSFSCTQKIAVGMPLFEADMWESLDSSLSKGADVVNILSQKWMPVEKPYNVLCPLKSVTLRMFSEVMDNKIELVDQIYICVDGGFHKEKDLCTWALVAFVVDSSLNAQVLCSSGGIAPVDPDSHCCLGGVSKSAYHAELYAQIMARIFITQHCQEIGAKAITICYIPFQLP